MSCPSGRRCRARLAGRARRACSVGDEVVALNGQVPRDVIQWQLLADERRPRARGRAAAASTLTIEVAKRDGRAARRRGAARRCSTRCAPATTTASSASSTSCRRGCGRSLYLKDDDYRLSFLYGNFTTLTRFTEADLERVVTEGLSPAATSASTPPTPTCAREMLRNRRGATSLRWLRALLDHGIDGARPGRRVPGRQRRRRARRHARRRARPVPRAGQSLCVVPLGVSRLQPEPRMRPAHRGRGRGRRRLRRALAGHLPRACSAAAWSSPPTSTTCSPTGPSPSADAYEGFPMHEDGVGMARTFELELHGRVDDADRRRRPGFFAWVDGATGRGLPGATAGRAARPAGRCSGRRARRAGRRSSPASTAPGSSRRSSTASAAPTSASSRCATSSSAATSASPACWSARTSPGCWPTSPRATATCCPTSASPRAASSTASRLADLPRPVEVVATDGIALRARPRTSSRGMSAVASTPVVAIVGRPNVGKSHAREPHRRAPRGDRRGEARRHPRPQGGRGRVAGRPVHASSTPAAGCPAAPTSTRR